MLNQDENDFYDWITCIIDIWPIWREFQERNEDPIRIFLKKVHIFLMHFDVFCGVTYHAYGTQVEMP